MTDLAAADQQVAAQLIERLLTDPGFRTRFRRDPAKACREAGLDSVADEMGMASGGAMMTLEVRESRSSLAGVMMAAAMEGVGVYEFTKHVVPHLEDAASSIGGVLSHVNLPSIKGALPDISLGGGGGSNAAAFTPDGLPPGVTPDAGGGGGAAAAATTDAAANGGGGGAGGAAAAVADAPPAAKGAPPVAAPSGADAQLPTATASAEAPVDPSLSPADAALPNATDLPDAGSVSAANLPDAAAPAAPVAAAPVLDPTQAAAAPAAPAAVAPVVDPSQAAPAGGGGADHAAAAADASAGGGGGVEPTPDPSQYGMAGSGGPPSLEAKAVLDSHNITLDPNGTKDFKGGRIDPRLAAVMLKLAEKHKITITCTSSDHPELTTGGSQSNHFYGRGLDIGTVDGELVRPGSPAAREVAAALADLDPKIRPTEVGSPFAIGAPGYFTDGDHQDHIHVAFDEPISKDWKAPADIQALDGGSGSSSAPGAALTGGGTDASAGPAAAASAAPVAPAPAVAPVAPVAAAVPGAAPPPGVAPAAAAAPVIDGPVNKGQTASFLSVDPKASAAAAGRQTASFLAVGGRSAPSGPAHMLADPASVPAAVDATAAAAAGGGGSSDLGSSALGFAQGELAKGVHETGVNTGVDVDKYLAAAGVGPGNPWCASFVTWSMAQAGHKMPGSGWAAVSTWVQHAEAHQDGLQVVSAADARPGDIVAYDWGGGEDFSSDGHIGFVASKVEGGNFTALEGNAHDAVMKVPRHMGDGVNIKFLRLTGDGTPPAGSAPSAAASAAAATPGAPAAPGGGGVAAAALENVSGTGPSGYPGDHASKAEIALWMAKRAEAAGLPPELPVMASLVESNVQNLDYGDASSQGYFQMLTTLWDSGKYKGFQKDPEKQIQWFIDHAAPYKAQFGHLAHNSQNLGNWIADTERPAEQYRGRYALRFDEARALIEQGKAKAAAHAPAAPVAPVAPAAPVVDPSHLAATGGGVAEHAAAAAEVGPPPDPSQYGVSGSGGPPSLEAKAVLDSDKITLDPEGTKAFKGGRVDPRVSAVMLKLAEKHKITITSPSADSPEMAVGGAKSNSFLGRGLDISTVDGELVRPGSPAAREVAAALADLDPKIRPTEVGSPFAIGAPGYFTDGAHQDHIHIGFDDPISKDWKPPADVQSLLGGGTDASATPAAAPPVAPPAPVAPAPAVAPVAPVAAAVPGAAPPPGVAPAAAAAPVIDGPVNKGQTASFLSVDPKASAAAAGRQTASFLAVGGRSAPSGPAHMLADPASVPAAVDATAAAAAGGGGSSDLGSSALGFAQGELAKGVHETGVNTGVDVDKYLAAAGVGPGNPWCASFVTWSMAQAGHKMPGSGWAAVSTWVQHAEAHQDGLQVVSAADARPGDIVAYDWGGGEDFSSDGHIGFVASKVEGGNFTALEGNAHDAVMKVPRHMGDGVNIKFLRLTGDGTPPAGSAPPAAAPPVQVPEPAAPGGAVEAAASAVSDVYPGDNAPKEQVAAWMAKMAEERGLPRELPIMASMVESGMRNLHYGDADSVGFFQMRVGIWNRGDYAGFSDKPELQVKWFLDQAVAAKRQRIAQGLPIDDPKHYGDWIADVERPAAQYRGRYQLKLAEAQNLLKTAGAPSAQAPAAAAAAVDPAQAQAQAAASAAPPPAAADAAAAAGGGGGKPQTAGFLAVKAQESSAHGQTAQFLKAVDPKMAAAHAAGASPEQLAAAASGQQPPAAPVDPNAQPAAAGAAPAAAAALDLSTTTGDYPGDHAPQEQIARWMAKHAEAAGLPPELPVMASLVESNMQNLHYGDASSVGYFQMLTSIWNTGKYAGYQDDPQKQLQWFIDHALEVKHQRMAAGLPLNDPNQFGTWVADTERPAAQYRGRYQLRLDQARKLLGM